jgi:hypothetical protein
MQWIGKSSLSIIDNEREWSDLKKRTLAGDGLKDLSALAATFNQAIDGVLNALPQRPLCTYESNCQPRISSVAAGGEGQTTVGQIIRLEVKENDDYPKWSDMFIAYSSADLLWLACHSRNVPFYSCRYSRCNETFCYLKLDGRHLPPGATWSDRGGIEDQLDEFLVSNGIGCIFGGGTGLLYSYIFLVVLNVFENAPTLCSKLRAIGMPQRAWILFYDAHLDDEWIGVHHNTPPPP